MRSLFIGFLSTVVLANICIVMGKITIHFSSALQNDPVPAIIVGFVEFGLLALTLLFLVGVGEWVDGAIKRIGRDLLMRKIRRNNARRLSSKE
jgi:hypothetical protein